ncbi:hypothetical protein, partial [Acinetobacter baumannii]|uniref:hypothetical protein n=1 Tax=Acinetobacter baumannii TaxID=470 RepID=UPI001C074C0A
KKKKKKNKQTNKQLLNVSQSHQEVGSELDERRIFCNFQSTFHVRTDPRSAGGSPIACGLAVCAVSI